MTLPGLNFTFQFNWHPQHLSFEVAIHLLYIYIYIHTYTNKEDVCKLPIIQCTLLMVSSVFGGKIAFDVSNTAPKLDRDSLKLTVMLHDNGHNVLVHIHSHSHNVLKNS
jgi:hypothetical protein